MIPPRAYRIPEGMFTADSHHIRPLSLFCLMCHKSLGSNTEPDLWAWVDMAVLVEKCRQHEIAEHSQQVTWQEFCQGYRYQDWRSSWSSWGHGVTGSPDWRELRNGVFEWLDEPECSVGMEPPSVMVRNPELILKWKLRHHWDRVPA